MEIDEFNSLKLLYDSALKVNMKPEDQIKSPGLYGTKSPSPRVGYLTGMAESGYRACILMSQLPYENEEGAGFSYTTIEDIESIQIFERSKEGKLAQIVKREDGKGTCIVREVKAQ